MFSACCVPPVNDDDHIPQESEMKVDADSDAHLPALLGAATPDLSKTPSSTGLPLHEAETSSAHAGDKGTETQVAQVPSAVVADPEVEPKATASEAAGTQAQVTAEIQEGPPKSDLAKKQFLMEEFEREKAELQKDIDAFQKRKEDITARNERSQREASLRQALQSAQRLNYGSAQSAIKGGGPSMAIGQSSIPPIMCPPVPPEEVEQLRHDMNRIQARLRVLNQKEKIAMGLIDPPKVVSPTMGLVEKSNDGSFKPCVVSFPASESEAWEQMLAQSVYNYCCVWTGKNDSPPQDWYTPWKKNLLEAQKLKCTLIVVAPRERVFGKGQTLEIQQSLSHLDFKVVPVEKFEELNKRIAVFKKTSRRSFHYAQARKDQMAVLMEISNRHDSTHSIDIDECTFTEDPAFMAACSSVE